MATGKRYRTFTLRRTPFWLFFLAGISATTLTPLITEPELALAGTWLAVGVIVATVAARFRDIGCSAWFTPLALLPLIAILAGITASDDQDGHPGQIEYRVIGTTLASLTLLISWISYLYVH